MASLGDSVLDAALQYIIDNGDVLYICSAEPTTYTEASDTYCLGSKSGPTIGSLTDAAGGGRQITVSAIADGSVTASDDASHYGIVDDGSSDLLAAGALSAPQAVTSGNTFTLTSLTITIPDPA